MSKALNRTGKTIVADRVIELFGNEDSDIVSSVEENAEYTAFASNYNLSVSGIFSATKNEPARIYFDIFYKGEPLSKDTNGSLFGSSVIVKGNNPIGDVISTKQYVVGTFEYITIPIDMVAYDGAQFLFEWNGGINGVNHTLRANFSIGYGTVTQYAFSYATTEEEIKAESLEWTYEKPDATQSMLTLWSRESSMYDYYTGEYINWRYFKLQEPYLSISPSKQFVQLSPRGVVTEDQEIIFYAITNSSSRPTWIVDDRRIEDDSTGTYSINEDGNLVMRIVANNQPFLNINVQCTLAGVKASLFINGVSTGAQKADIVTDSFDVSNKPTTYKTGEPLIDGDYALGTVVDGDTEYTEVFRYTIDNYGNGDWHPLERDDSNYAEIIAGCLDYVTKSDDVEREIKALNGWFQNIFSKRAVIEQIETMGITLQKGGVIKSKKYDEGAGAGFYLDGDTGIATFREVNAVGGNFELVTITGEVTTKVLYTQNEKHGLEGGVTANSIKAPFGYDNYELYESLSPLLQKDGIFEERYTGNYGNSNFIKTIYLSSNARTNKNVEINQQNVVDGTIFSFTPTNNARVYISGNVFKKNYTENKSGYTLRSGTSSGTSVPQDTYPPLVPQSGGKYYTYRITNTTTTYIYTKETYQYSISFGRWDLKSTTTETSFVPPFVFDNSFPANPYIGQEHQVVSWEYDSANNNYIVTTENYLYGGFGQWIQKGSEPAELSTAYAPTTNVPSNPTDGTTYFSYSPNIGKEKKTYTYNYTEYTYYSNNSTGSLNAEMQYSLNGNNWNTAPSYVDVSYGQTIYVRQLPPSPLTDNTGFAWNSTVAGTIVVSSSLEMYSTGISFIASNMSSVGNIQSSHAIKTNAVTVSDSGSTIFTFNGTSSYVGLTLYGRFAGVTPEEGSFTDIDVFNSLEWKEFNKDPVVVSKSEIARVNWSNNGFFVTDKNLHVISLNPNMWLSYVNISFSPVDTYPAVYTQNIYPFDDREYKIGDENQRFKEIHADRLYGEATSSQMASLKVNVEDLRNAGFYTDTYVDEQRYVRALTKWASTFYLGKTIFGTNDDFNGFFFMNAKGPEIASNGYANNTTGVLFSNGGYARRFGTSGSSWYYYEKDSEVR